MVPTRKSHASESRSCHRPCGSIVVKRFWIQPRGTLCDELRIPFENCNRATTECDLGDDSIALPCLPRVHSDISCIHTSQTVARYLHFKQTPVKGPDAIRRGRPLGALGLEGLLCPLVGRSRFLSETYRSNDHTRFTESNLVDSASSHTLVSKIKPCMSKYKRLYTVKLRTAH